jgi:hypothetical protein
LSHGQRVNTLFKFTINEHAHTYKLTSAELLIVLRIVRPIASVKNLSNLSDAMARSKEAKKQKWFTVLNTN